MESRSDSRRPALPDETCYVLRPSASEGLGEVVSHGHVGVLNRPGEQQRRGQPVNAGRSGKDDTAVVKPRQNKRRD